MTHMELREDGIWECPKCNMKKIPIEIWKSEKLFTHFLFIYN